jgi:predicted molibdopterin-dependent oxidoreductase YjgC
VGSHKLDSSARYGQINAVRALRRVQGTHRWSVSFEDLVAANVLLLVGTNITETNPITGLKVKEAVKKHGATLLTIEALVPAVGTISNIANLSGHHFPARPDQFGSVVLGIIKGLVESDLIDVDLKRRAPGYVQAITNAVGAIAWPQLEASSGATSEAIIQAARVFAGAPRAVIVAGQGVLRHPGGSGLVATLLDILLLTGHHGRPGSGLAPLAEENNDQGAVEMGAVAEYLPGPSDLEDRVARERLAGMWKEELPTGPARNLMEIVEDARSGFVKAMFVVGENPIGSLPPSAGVREALTGLDFLVCQELFLTETAAMAHVVLPACSYAEKDGTFTNTEGHVQPVRQAIAPIGESRPDWEILSAISVLMGYPIEYGDAQEIFKEIRGLIPDYGLLGVAPNPLHPDRAVVDRYLQQGYTDDVASRYSLTGKGQEARGERKEKRLALVVSQTLFHSGKLSTKAKGLMQVQASGHLAMNPEDAQRVGVADGDRVRVFNDCGEMIASVKLLGRLPEGVATFPEHFDEEARRLLSVSIDPQTGAPYYKSAQVKVEKARG